MASKLDNAKHNIKRSEHLTDTEKELLLLEINANNVDEVIKMKNKMIVNNVKFVCLYCGEEFKPDISNKNFLIQKYCSIEHQIKYLDRKRTDVHIGDVRKCSECGKEFHIKCAANIYCDECADKMYKVSKKNYKKRQQALKPPKEKKVKVVVVKEPKPPRPKKEKKVLTEKDILRNKLIKRQKKIEGMDNLFLACKAQIELNEEIRIHFPEGL